MDSAEVFQILCIKFILFKSDASLHSVPLEIEM